MDILSSSPSLPASFPSNVSFSGVTDAVSSLPFDRVGDAIESITPDFDDVSEVATTVVRSGGRLGIRTVRTTGRMVRRHPRGAATMLAVVIAVVAATLFLKKRNENAQVAEAS